MGINKIITNAFIIRKKIRNNKSGKY